MLSGMGQGVAGLGRVCALKPRVCLNALNVCLMPSHPRRPFDTTGASERVKVGDPRLKHDNASQRSRGTIMQEKRVAYVASVHGRRQGSSRVTFANYERASNVFGVWGSCEFARLPYVDLQHLFTVPLGHAFLHGVVHAWVDYVLDHILSADQRKVVAERGNHFYVTSDFGRAYKCVVTYRWAQASGLSFPHLSPFVVRTLPVPPWP